jgi:tetratricopeptide (TPR) repeat protein
MRARVADTYRSMGRLDEAAAAAERSLAIDEASLGPGHPETAIVRGILGTIREEQGRVDEAIALHRRTLEDQTRIFGSDSPRLTYGLAALGTDYLDQDRASDALPLFEKGVALMEKGHVAPTHPTLVYLRLSMGQAQIKLGKPELAVAPLERVLTSPVAGTDVRIRSATEVALADALWKTGGDRKRARTLAEKARADAEGIAGPVGDDARKKARAWLAAHR